MLKIDLSWLQSLGLSDDLPADHVNELLRFAYQTLEMRTGMQLADQMTNTQLDEFEAYFEANDERGAFEWLEANFPNYKEIVQDQYGALSDELREAIPEIEADIRAAASA
jgi:hypothetical protein